MTVLPFPEPAEEPDHISQAQLVDLRQRLAEYEAMERRIGELSAALIADLSSGKPVQKGMLTARISVRREGPDSVLKIVIEAA